MDYVKINNEVYDVIVLSVNESFNILYTENTGRTLGRGAPMILDPIGAFIGHTVVFGRRNGKEEQFDRLFDLVSQPRYKGIPVELVHNQTTIKYDAYVSSGNRQLKKINRDNGTVYWEPLSVNFIPMKAQVTP